MKLLIAIQKHAFVSLRRMRRADGSLRFIILLPLLLMACAEHNSPIVPIFVRINGDQLTKDFPPDNKEGWADGCESGYAVYGTNVYKTFNGFKRDTTKVGNYGYETEWYNGYNYCRQAANTTYNQDIFW